MSDWKQRIIDTLQPHKGERVEDHFAYTAELLEPLIKQAQAEAWGEGAQTVWSDWSESEGPFLDDVEDTFPNPYRAADD